MSTIPIFIVDAFTSALFRGNPAAVCLLESWPGDALLQSIAAENCFAETAFLVPRGAAVFEIRWMTPRVEVDLCGHATLASAHVLWRHRDVQASEIRFESRRAGTLPVRLEGDRYTLDFPARPAARVEIPVVLAKGLGRAPVEVRKSRDYLVVFDTESEVRSLTPDFWELSKLDALGVIVTAPGSAGIDFVSRFFAPRAGIDEDPVTGSAHCTLTPYWAERLGKDQLQARQVSARGGDLSCTLAGDRVHIAGQAVTYMAGELAL